MTLAIKLDLNNVKVNWRAKKLGQMSFHSTVSLDTLTDRHTHTDTCYTAD